MPTGPRRKPIAERFWPKVQKTDGCWLWTGAKMATGYGCIGAGDRRITLKTHRVSWELHFGPIPKGLWVLHRCDNPPCVRPDHLFLGTCTDNVQDMHAKGRWHQKPLEKFLRGERHWRTTLTDDQVQEIRRRYALGTTQQALANEFGVSQSAISQFVRRITWAHI